MVLKESRLPVSKSSNSNEATNLSSESDYVLNLTTTSWNHLPGAGYSVNYWVNLRLTDVKKKDVISKGFCSYNSRSAGNPTVSHQKLIANDAEYIKQRLADATEFCVDQFNKELFS